MIGLSDIINLIWVDGDKPIRIITEDGETPKCRDSDITDELESTVVGINIYDDYIEIELGEQMTKELTAQQRANKKWNERNREHRNYLTKRSTARGFIRNHATKNDLLELQELIKESFKNYKNS